MSPNDPRESVEWGRSLALAGWLPEARGQFRRALALDPGRAGATRGLIDLDRIPAGPAASDAAAPVSGGAGSCAERASG